MGEYSIEVVDWVIIDCYEELLAYRQSRIGASEAE